MAYPLQQAFSFMKSSAIPAAASAASVFSQLQSTAIPAALSAASVANGYAQATALPAAFSAASVANEYVQSTAISPAFSVVSVANEYIHSATISPATSAASAANNFVQSTAISPAISVVSVVNGYVPSAALSAAVSAASAANDYVQAAVLSAANSGASVAQSHILTAIGPAAEAYSNAIAVLSSAAESVNSTEETVNPDLSQPQLILKEKGLEAWNSHVHDNRPLGEIMQPSFGFITPVVNFVAKNPRLLLPLAVPALQPALLLLGFAESGIVAGSIAASLQGSIGDAPQESLLAFLEGYGAKGFATQAIELGPMWIAIAVLLATVGKFLIDRGAPPDFVSFGLSKAWNSILVSFGKGDTVMVSVQQ